MQYAKPLLYYLLLALFIAGLGYVSWFIYRDEQIKIDLGAALPLFEISDYDFIRYDANGKRTYTIEGPYMHHYDDDRGSFLINPFMTHYISQVAAQTQSPSSVSDWTAQSREALISSDNTLITMNENVLLKRKDLATDELTTLKTSQLFLHDKGDKVTSDQFVTILSYPNNTLEGTGLLGYPSIGLFNLLDNIESYYETKKK